MTTERLPASPDIITQGGNLLALLGGTKSTSNAGDTAALQQLFGQLQGTDYEAMLQAIFNKAGGQIPGIQQALGNAIGARSGGNSAVQAALSKLLAQTSTNAMDQVAKLQSQNYSTQAQVGNSIAQATAGTTKKTGTDVNSGLTQAAKILGLLQATKALGINDAVKGMFSSDKTAGGTSGTASQTTAAAQPVQSAAAPLTSAAAPMFNLTGSFDQQPAYQVDYTGIPQNTDSGFEYQDMTGFQQPYEPVEYTPSFEPTPGYESVLPADNYDEMFTFADGGIVRSPQGKAKGFADGGTVRAGGSRRSANPEINLSAPVTTAVQNSTPILSAPSPVPQQQAQPEFNPFAESADRGGNRDGAVGGFNTNAGGVSTGTARNVVGTIGNLNNLSGLAGGPTLGAGASAGLGLIGGLAKAETPGEAAMAVGRTALNLASPLGSAALGFATDPSVKTGVNIATSMHPIGATYNALANVLGFATAGEVVDNIKDALSPRQMMTPDQQAMVAAEQAQPATLGSMPGVSGGGDSGEGTGYGAGYGGNIGTGGLAGGFQSSFGSGSVGGTGGGFGRGGGGFNGDGGESGGVGSSGIGNRGDMANGGPIAGRGTGTSDSININVSDGEYIMSADTVEALGEDFFNQLQAAFHKPVNQQHA